MRISITTRNHTLTIPTFHDSYASTTYLSNPCPPEDAWGRATKYTSCDVAGDNLHLSQTVPLYFFSPFLYCVPAGVLWPSSPLFPSGALVNAVLMFALLSLWRTWPIHLQCIPWIVLDIRIVDVCSYSCWFDILSGQCIFKILRRYFR